LKNDGVSEDAVKTGEERVQKLTDNYIAKVEAFCRKRKRYYVGIIVMF
jgi:ribosome recycling factor